MKIKPVLVLSVLAILAVPALAGLSKDSIKTTLDEFNVEYRSVRPDFLTYSTYTLKVGSKDFMCDIPQSLRRLGANGEVFRIKKIKTKRGHFLVEMETRGKTRLTISAYDRGRLSQGFLDSGLIRMLSDIFEFGNPPSPVKFVGHIESDLLHLDRCNHLPKKELQRVFRTEKEALTAGFRECPICFASVDNLPYRGYLGNRIRGLQEARLFELVHPRSADQVLQTQLDQLGEEVLSNWPMELSGFENDFRVVVGDQPLAVSFCTGIVMVSDTLLKAADAEEEILFVLAHEIAHCELHLAPRSPFGGRWYGNPLDQDYRSYWIWTSHQEITADLVAMAWFKGLPSGNRDLSRARAALAKVQYAAGATDEVSPEWGQSVGLHQRMLLFEPTSFHLGNMTQVFTAIDGEGDVRHELRFLGLLRDNGDNRNQVYLLLTTTDNQDENVGNYRGEIKDAKGKGAYLEILPFLGVPGFTTMVIGQTQFNGYFDDFSPGLLSKLALSNLKGIKKWKNSESNEIPFEAKNDTGLR